MERLMYVTRHQNLYRQQQQEDANNSMTGEADLAKLSIQKSIWWKTMRKEEMCYTHAISTYGIRVCTLGTPGT